MVVKLERLLGARAAEFAIGAVDLRRPPGVAALAVGMMFLDQFPVGALDGRAVGAGLKPERCISRCDPRPSCGRSNLLSWQREKWRE